MKWFGAYWGVAATENQPHVATPLGAPCGYCTVPIQDGDQGYLIGRIGTGPDGRPSWAGEVPWHRECLLRTVFGPPSHLDGSCTCRSVPDQPATPQQQRAEAIETWDRLDRRTPG